MARHPLVHLLIDIVNPLDFPGAERLLPRALRAARHIGGLKQRLGHAGVPTVFVNDNFDQWQLSFHDLVERYRETAPPGAALLRYVSPVQGDHYILKPKHSAFYATSLDVLLDAWHAERLILTGIAGNICVLFTANDAHMRGYDLIVPADCIASETDMDDRWALNQMRRVLSADVRASASLIDVAEATSSSKEQARAAG